jgi:myo-inositol-1(or 4)-monophosphatase
MLQVSIHAAREAGRVLLDAYEKPHEIKVKGLRDISTEADLEAEALTMGIIREGCPEARFMSEETSYAQVDYGDAPTWYIDPLDGTTNYARGLPGFSVSVGMAQRGIMQCGAVYDPLSDQLFTAARGQGAFLNERPLRISDTETLMESIVMLDWPREQALRETSARFLARLAPLVDTVRSRGSAALGICGIAAGWADAYFQFTLSPWDVAAGVLIVEEAGGKVTDMHGQPYHLHQPSWLVSNGRIHQALLDLRPYG